MDRGGSRIFTLCNLALAVALAPFAMGVAADALPSPPCGAASVPSYGPVGPVPELRSWPAEAVTGWQPPACTGWATRADARVVAAAGTIRGSEDDILGRIGALSHQTAIRYWSAGRGDWRAMLDDATALAKPEARSRRADFAPEELIKGARVHLAYDDAEPIGAVVHQLDIRERTPSRVVVTTSNMTAARLMGMTVAAPGDLEMAIFLDREAPDVWRYYALSRFALRLPASMQPTDLDYLNRATAMFRFLAGVPTDAMPPAAPGVPVRAEVGPIAARSD